MRKRILVLLLAGVMAASAAQAEVGLTVRGQAAATLGLSNFLRGGAVGGQVIYRLFGFLPIGIETYAEYDTWFNVFQIPVNLVLGKNFQLLVGVVIPLGEPEVKSEAGTLYKYSFATFPNNFGLGVHLPIVGRNEPLTIDLYSEITYTLSTPVTESDVDAIFGSLIGALMGLKAYVGVAVGLNL